MLELGFAQAAPATCGAGSGSSSTRPARSGATATRGGSLREYLRWADLQSAEGARVVETVLPETDDDAVRILTIHGAKGLSSRSRSCRA